MKIVLTVKCVSDGPEPQNMTPLEMHEVVEYFENLRESGVFGPPAIIQTRYMVEGHAAFASEVPGVRLETPSPVTDDSPKGKKPSARLRKSVRSDHPKDS